MVSGAGLQGVETATTVQVRGGERLLTDGPFADTKEHLIGFYVIDVPDLDTALDVGGEGAERAHRQRRGPARHARRRGRPRRRDRLGGRGLTCAVTPLERAFREERAQVVATVARRLGDLQLAEDAVSEAFAAAAATWPSAGVPDRPGAWLTTTAWRKALDVVRRDRSAPGRRGRRRRCRRRRSPACATEDDLLQLVLTCCHPALAIEARVALTLRHVAGLSVPEIAAGFLVSEDDDGQAAGPGAHQDPPERHLVRAARTRRSGSGWPACRRCSTWCSPRATWPAATVPPSERSSATRRSGWPGRCTGCCR